MKILYDYQIFWDQQYGGPSRYFVNLAKNLIQNNEIKICAPLYINKYLSELPKHSVQGLEVSNKITRFIPTNIKNKINELIFNRLNKKLTNTFYEKFKPDIVHKTYYDKYEKKDKPSVITVYDLIHEKFHKEYRKNSSYRPKKIALENADKIICISKNTANDLKEYYNINEDKIEVVYLANSLLNTNEDYKYSSYLDITDKNYLLFVGKRFGYKNFLNFIKAYSYSSQLKKDFKIICFGNIPFTNTEKLEFKRLKLNSKNIIQVTGNDKLLTHLYQNAKALIYPSLYEGFGIPILEAMSLNCPVICSNAASLTEVGGSAVEYFNPHNLEEIKNTIIKTIYNNSNLKLLIKEGQKQEKLFSWKKCSDETLSIYKKLI